MDKVFILGADDPEMEEIVEQLLTHKLAFEFAAVDGKRCHPGSAYATDSTVSADGSQTRQLGSNYDNFIFVECRPIGVTLEQKHTRLTTIDHHEEGDFGYDLGPAYFWEASSLGQLIKLLHALGHQITITQEMRVLAAMDHCRQAAIRGECPGVSADEVITQRVASLATRHRLSTSIVELTIANFVTTFRRSKIVGFGGGTVIDFTDNHLGIGYNLNWLCAQTALDILGLTALLRNNESDSPRDEKIMISGHATPEMVKHFITVYAPAKQLHRVFGVPKRGYAGGYLYP